METFATTSAHRAAFWAYGLGEMQNSVKACGLRAWNCQTACSWRLREERLAMALTNGVRMASSIATQTEKKIAKLNVKKEHTVTLPTFSDLSGNPQRLSVFLREPEGKQCMLNTKALRKYEDVGNGVFRCYLPTMEFLSFEVAPVLDLLVEADEDSCLVDMLSCKFEGSNLVQSHNERFSANLRNQLSWSTPEDEEQCLFLRLELNVALEVYTLPFTLLPIATVESPGTLILQTLVDRLIPMFLDQLFADYRAWAEARISRANGC